MCQRLGLDQRLQGPGCGSAPSQLCRTCPDPHHTQFLSVFLEPIIIPLAPYRDTQRELLTNTIKDVAAASSWRAGSILCWEIALRRIVYLRLGMVGRKLSLKSFQLVPSFAAGLCHSPLPGSRGKPLAALQPLFTGQHPSPAPLSTQAFGMDPEEHSVIMQQVMELEVQCPQCAAGVGLGGCSASEPLELGFGLSWGCHCRGGS